MNSLYDKPIYLDIKTVEACVVKEDLVRVSILKLQTYIRKEYKGVWYLIPISRTYELPEYITNHTLDPISQFIRECHIIQLFYKLPSPVCDNVTGELLVKEDECKLPEEDRIIKRYSLGIFLK